MAMEPEISTDRVQKFADDLEAEKTILCTCKELFTNLSNHFKTLEDSLSLRSKSVESKLQTLESTSRQTLESLSQREDSIPHREAEAVERVRQRKQAAIAEIEKPTSGELGLSETMRSLAMRMDSLGLVKFLILKRREPALLKAELPGAINESIDPPRLVLNAVEDFLETKAAKAGIMDKRWAVGMLVHALFPNLKPDSHAKSGEENVDLGPKFAKSVVESAWRVLESWKGHVETNEHSNDFGRFGPVEAVMFLEMVAGFGLKSRFDEEFLKKMVVGFSSRRDIAKLASCLGFGEKLADIIDELVKEGKEIDAVYFVTESGMTEKFSPVSLLKSFLKNSKKNAMDALKKGNSSAAASEESSNIELNAIKAVVRCVEDQKLESVFTLDVLKKRANVLEKAKAERKNRSGSAPSSSKMDRELLVQELDRTEAELQSSSLSIEKLEESISSIALESQCEIESMKLDLMALEQKYFEAKKVQEETLKENARLNNLIDELEVRNEDAQGVIINQLEKENKDLRERMDFSESNARVFCQRIEECIEEMQNNGRKLEFSHQHLLTKAGLSKEMGEIFGALIAKLANLHSPNPVLKEKMEKMSLELQEYEQLVKQLKEELRDEKFKAREEAEDLAQEMAELRYEMTCLLEEERKRRASIEQASLQRIAELDPPFPGLLPLPDFFELQKFKADAQSPSKNFKISRYKN